VTVAVVTVSYTAASWQHNYLLIADCSQNITIKFCRWAEDWHKMLAAHFSSESFVKSEHNKTLSIYLPLAAVARGYLCSQLEL